VTGPGPATALRAALDREISGAVRLRRELHAGAELSGAEHRTAARVAAALGAADAPVIAGTGRIVRVGPPSGPCIAIRAELDALPVAEQTGVPWASATGAMHACGHDVHLAALAALGRAARGVAQAAGLPVALLAVLQPREEGYPSGARDIAASAEFAAQQPGAVLGVHLQHQVPPGTVAAPAGTVNASTDDFEIRVEGTGGHAGYPHLAADPVPVLCQVVLALQQIASRRIDPTHAVAVSVGALQAGQAPNVIPESATARGTLRALDPDDRPVLRQALREIVEHTCRAHGCRGIVTIDEGEPALANSEPLAEASWPLLREAGFVVDTSFRSCGADDFSYYSRYAPILMLFVGAGGSVTLHHPRFLPPDGAVGQVASVMLAGYLAALSLLLSPGPAPLSPGPTPLSPGRPRYPPGRPRHKVCIGYLYSWCYAYGMTTHDAAGRDASSSQDESGSSTGVTIGEALYGLVTLAVRNGPREISLTAASTLSTLDRTGARRLTDLAMIEGVTQPSMSVLVTGLERAGLAERRPDPADKRVVLVALTPAGADYIRARRQAGAATFADLIDKLPGDETAALAAAVPALNRLRELDSDRRSAAADRPPARSSG